jgi:hypothetical protein
MRSSGLDVAFQNTTSSPGRDREAATTLVRRGLLNIPLHIVRT